MLPKLCVLGRRSEMGVGLTGRTYLRFRKWHLAAFCELRATSGSFFTHFTSGWWLQRVFIPTPWPRALIPNSPRAVSSEMPSSDILPVYEICSFLTAHEFSYTCATTTSCRPLLCSFPFPYISLDVKTPAMPSFHKGSAILPCELRTPPTNSRAFCIPSDINSEKTLEGVA